MQYYRQQDGMHPVRLKDVRVDTDLSLKDTRLHLDFPHKNLRSCLPLDLPLTDLRLDLDLDPLKELRYKLHFPCRDGNLTCPSKI